MMENISIAEWLNENTDEYRYLLVDPFKELADWNPLDPDQLYKHQGSGSLRRVLRPDFAWSPKHCPLLLLLAPPGEQCDEELVQYSEEYARGEVLYEKRCVCGWLSSVLDPDAMAAWLAELCRSIKQGVVIPVFEPLRIELLQATAAPEMLSGLISPVSQWQIISSNGDLMTLSGKCTDKAWELSWGTEQAQSDAREIRRLLSAWEDAASNLPEQAARLAVDAWKFTEKVGLHDLSDRLYLALNKLTLPADITKHAAVQEMLQQAAGNPDLRFEQLIQALPDTVWQELHHA